MVPFLPWHIPMIRPGELEYGIFDGLDHANFLNGQITLTGPAWSAINGAGVEASCGVEIRRPGFGSAWFIGSDEIRRHATFLARTVDRMMRMVEANCHLRRLEVVCREDCVKARRWIDWLGFDLEAEMMGWGPKGETYCLYARVGK